ncbi:hypothetical protein EAI80_08570 [Catenibacterium sp. co_0103]|nr:hypothetical protein [Catenibacterium sp. BIOML-A1]RYT46899.1 hypothetical protein EAI80_08570 [Catenibacterium sp. co_0103]
MSIIYGYLSKLVLSFDMLAGRLEIFPMLMIFSKTLWKSGQLCPFFSCIFITLYNVIFLLR